MKNEICNGKVQWCHSQDLLWIANSGDQPQEGLNCKPYNP